MRHPITVGSAYRNSFTRSSAVQFHPYASLNKQPESSDGRSSPSPAALPEAPAIAALVTTTSRNLGFYNPRHHRRLNDLLSDCLSRFVRPVVLHVRSNPHNDAYDGITAFAQNRLNRKRLKYAYVRATEDSGYLHQHWFFVLDLADGDVVAEIEALFMALRANHYISDYRINSAKSVGDRGTDWEALPTLYLPLTYETFAQAFGWISYALKKRSKLPVLKSGRYPISFREAR